MASDGSSPRTSPVPSPPEKPKGISRKKKSASQTQVLERAYAVEKYPSEATRSVLGRELDLSDKQLQIWFTHRRYKDRRDGIDDEKLTFYAKNKSSADHISNHIPKHVPNHVPNHVPKHAPNHLPNHIPNQVPNHFLTEECRSSKKQEIDPLTMEEEDDSEPDGYPARVLAEERDDDELIAEHKHTNGVDVPSNIGYGDLEKMKPGPKRKGAPRLPKDPSMPPRRPGPKPKFNAMAATERAAITAVESQLCGPLREDGPPLGFEFDPLPPRAFTELPITEAAPYTPVVSREAGSESYSEKTALQNKWAKELDLAEKKRKIAGVQIGPYKLGRGENGYRS